MERLMGIPVKSLVLMGTIQGLMVSLALGQWKLDKSECAVEFSVRNVEEMPGPELPPDFVTTETGKTGELKSPGQGYPAIVTTTAGLPQTETGELPFDSRARPDEIDFGQFGTGRTRMEQKGLIGTANPRGVAYKRLFVTDSVPEDRKTGHACASVSVSYGTATFKRTASDTWISPRMALSLQGRLGSYGDYVAAGMTGEFVKDGVATPFDELVIAFDGEDDRTHRTNPDFALPGGDLDPDGLRFKGDCSSNLSTGPDEIPIREDELFTIRATLTLISNSTGDEASVLELKPTGPGLKILLDKEGVFGVFATQEDEGDKGDQSKTKKP